MSINDQGQTVRDAAETEAWVRGQLVTAKSEAELVALAKSDDVPGLVAKKILYQLEAAGELAKVGQRWRLR